MENKFNYLAFIKKIVSFSPRQSGRETRTAIFLMSELKKGRIDFFEQKFIAKVPVISEAVLAADGKKIKCEGSSFVGGKINGKENIVSSQMSSLLFQGKENINFNPSCSEISNSNYYFVPSVSISHANLRNILSAKKVRGRVKVCQKRYIASNILIGNRKNPQFIVFAHYDSIKKGAIDNASGVAVVFSSIVSNKNILDKCLFVFSANEELSYDKPIYWGHGYRVFEKKYLNLLKRAKKIIVVDCLGYSKSIINQDPHLKKLGFPIVNTNRLERKIYLLTAQKLDYLMSVYHSDLDDERGIKNKNLIEASILLKSIIS